MTSTDAPGSTSSAARSPGPVIETAPPSPDRVTGAERARRDAVRPDIQGLRALAVGIVMLYHFWPRRLGGGYVGVDVFFVISGFLITAHLLRHPVRTPRDLVAFWGRRIRRLVPAATVVLVATVLAGFLWLPETVFAQLAQQTAASSLYVENLVLARTSTDYLAQGELPSAVQHFWSLSVEEQFYIVWPLVVSLMILLATLVPARLRSGPTRRRAPGAAVALGLAVVAGASLAWSAWYTAADAAAAYFVTTTRVWELAIGGVLAAVVHSGFALKQAGVRALLAWCGLAMIVYASVAFSASTPFPGTAALVPTLGAVAVIAACSDGVRAGPGLLWRSRAVQRCGDLSYSLYLWHWPVLVIAPFALDATLRWPHKLALVVGVFVVSWFSKRLIEDGFRFRPGIAGSLPRTYLMLVVCLAASLGAAGALWLAARSADDGARLDVSDACFGAAAFRDRTCDPGTDDATMSPVFAKKDKPDVYADDCWNGRPFTRHQVCQYGNPDSDVRIALVGNSHAGHWQPPIARTVEEHGWHLDTYLVSECYTVDIPVEFSSQTLEDNCLAWNSWARQQIADGDYDLVIMSDRTASRPLDGVSKADKDKVAGESYTRVVQDFLDSGAKVLIMRDTPAALGPVPDCVARYPDDLGRCAARTATAMESDPLAEAGRAFPSGGVEVLDVGHLLCSGGACPAVVGGAITYFDHGHMTKTFAQTLYPEVSQAIEKQLGR